MSQVTQIFANRQFQNIALTQLLTVFSSNLIAPILPLYMALQGFSASQVGAVMGIAAVGAVVMRPWAGRSVDTRGSRPTAIFGQILTASCFVLFLMLNGFLPLLGIRFLQGVSLAFFGTASVTFASCVETPENTPAAISMYTVFTMIGMGAATSLAPLFFEAAGFVPVVFVSLAAVSVGFAILSLRAVSIPLCADAARVPFMEVLRAKTVMAPTISLFASNFAFSTAFTFVPLTALAFNVPGYHLFYIAFAVAVIIARVSVQALTQRYPVEPIAIVASLLNMFCVLLLAAYPSPVIFALSGIFVGFGFGLIFPVLTVSVVQRIDPANRGTALSILTAAGDVGNAIGASVLGLIADTLGFRALFLTAGAVVLVCNAYYYMMLRNNR